MRHVIINILAFVTIFWAVGHLLDGAGFLLPYLLSMVVTVVIFLTRHGLQHHD